MDTKETLRNQTIDAIKGFTIILVVLAHAIQRNIIDSESNIINCLINSFHMHLFMFLSGYLIAQSISKPRYKWLFKRFVRLILPFFGGYLISIHKDKIPNINLVYKLIIIFSFPLLFIIYRYFKLAPMWFYPWPISPTNAMFLTFRYLLAWSGVAATWLTISSIHNTNIKRPLSYIGLFTLDIYAIHLMVLRLGIGEEWLMVLTVTVFALAISLIVSWLIRRSKILTLIFFGQYDWNSNKLM